MPITGWRIGKGGVCLGTRVIGLKEEKHNVGKKGARDLKRFHSV